MTEDSLFRVSVKALIIDTHDRVLVVKEGDRPFWDLPGGGMEHGETIRQALARELHEEIGLAGDFRYELLSADDPHVLAGRPVHQLRLVYLVFPESMPDQAGEDGTAIEYVDPTGFESSEYVQERQVYQYWHALQ